MRTLLVFLISLNCWGYGATVWATSCATADVQAAINKAFDGDTVIIPNSVVGCTWTSGIATSKQITIRGQSPPTRKATAIDGVTIIHAAGANDLFDITTGTTYRTVMANIRFLVTTGTGNYIVWGGASNALPPLMHDMYFNVPDVQLNRAVQWLVTGGVMWNVTYQNSPRVSPNFHSLSGCLLIKSNKSWDDDSTMGQKDTGLGLANVYIEDSIFDNVEQCPDIDDNGRVVERHVTCTECSLLLHGPTSVTGGRSIEVYENTYTFVDEGASTANLQRYIWWRSGSGVVTNCSFESIDSQQYSQKPTWDATVENILNQAAHGCCTAAQCWHQPGTGANGMVQTPSNLSSGQGTENFQLTDATYFWNNTGSGQSLALLQIDGGSTGGGCPATSYTPALAYVQNHDFFLDTTSNPNSGAKPGWARFQYPHPLRPLRTFPTTGAQRPHTRMAFSLFAATGTIHAAAGTISGAGTIAK